MLRGEEMLQGAEMLQPTDEGAQRISVCLHRSQSTAGSFQKDWEQGRLQGWQQNAGPGQKLLKDGIHLSCCRE